MSTPEAAVRHAVTSHLPYDHNFHVIGTHRLTHEALVAYHYLGLRRGETQPRPVIGFSAVERIGEIWRDTGGGECGVPAQLNRHVLCLFGQNGNTLSPFTLVVGRVYGTAVAAVELVLGSDVTRRAEPLDGFFFLAVEQTGMDCELRALGQDGVVLEMTDNPYVPIVSTAAPG